MSEDNKIRFECPLCERKIEMTIERYTENIIKHLYQWKGYLTIEQIIRKNEEFLKSEGKKDE